LNLDIKKKYQNSLPKFKRPVGIFMVY